jgi:hypothetical protein
LKSAWANSLIDSILKKPITKKRAGGVAQGVGPAFKPQYCKQKKKKKEKKFSRSPRRMTQKFWLNLYSFSLKKQLERMLTVI